ncbi:MAG: hypothetical protein R2909_19660 [Gemmatimonadales bacterium]
MVLEALRAVNETTGALTIIITHNAGIAAIADRVIRMRDGSIASITENPARAPAAAVSW